MCELCVESVTAGIPDPVVKNLLAAVFGPPTKPDTPAEIRMETADKFLENVSRRLQDLDGSRLTFEDKLTWVAGYLGSALDVAAMAQSAVIVATELESVRQEVKALKLQVERLETERDALKAKNKNLIDGRVVREGTIANLRQNVTARDGTIANLRQNVTEKAQTIEDLSREVNALRAPLGINLHTGLPSRIPGATIREDKPFADRPSPWTSTTED